MCARLLLRDSDGKRRCFGKLDVSISVSQAVCLIIFEALAHVPLFASVWLREQSGSFVKVAPVVLLAQIIIILAYAVYVLSGLLVFVGVRRRRAGFLSPFLILTFIGATVSIMIPVVTLFFVVTSAQYIIGYPILFICMTYGSTIIALLVFAANGFFGIWIMIIARQASTEMQEQRLKARIQLGIEAEKTTTENQLHGEIRRLKEDLSKGRASKTAINISPDASMELEYYSQSASVSSRKPNSSENEGGALMTPSSSCDAAKGLTTFP